MTPSPEGDTNSDVRTESWVEAHQKRLQTAYQIARNRLLQAANVRKAYFDRHAKDAPLHIGELVYLRARGMPGRNKIQDAYRQSDRNDTNTVLHIW